MLDHFDSNTHYRDLPSDAFEKWTQTKSYQKYQSKLNGALKGVDVHIFYLISNEHDDRKRQTENHRLFWANYFKNAGAEVEIKIINLPSK